LNDEAFVPAGSILDGYAGVKVAGSVIVPEADRFLRRRTLVNSL